MQLIGQVDPSTGKPYTPTKINKMIEDRLFFAAARYKGQLESGGKMFDSNGGFTGTINR